MNLVTTLFNIRRAEPCSSGWRTLLAHLGKTHVDRDPLPLATILESNGLNHAVWALRATSATKGQLLAFAVDCLTASVADEVGPEIVVDALKTLRSPGRTDRERLAGLQSTLRELRLSPGTPERAKLSAGACYWTIKLALFGDPREGRPALEMVVWFCELLAHEARLGGPPSDRHKLREVFRRHFCTE